MPLLTRAIAYRQRLQSQTPERTQDACREMLATWEMLALRCLAVELGLFVPEETSNLIIIERIVFKLGALGELTDVDPASLAVEESPLHTSNQSRMFDDANAGVSVRAVTPFLLRSMPRQTSTPPVTPGGAATRSPAVATASTATTTTTSTADDVALQTGAGRSGALPLTPVPMRSVADETTSMSVGATTGARAGSREASPRYTPGRRPSTPEVALNNSQIPRNRLTYADTTELSHKYPYSPEHPRTYLSDTPFGYTPTSLGIDGDVSYDDVRRGRASPSVRNHLSVYSSPRLDSTPSRSRPGRSPTRPGSGYRSPHDRNLVRARLLESFSGATPPRF